MWQLQHCWWAREERTRGYVGSQESHLVSPSSNSRLSQPTTPLEGWSSPFWICQCDGTSGPQTRGQERGLGMGPGPGTGRRPLADKPGSTPTSHSQSSRRLAPPPYQAPGSPRTRSAEAPDSSVVGVSPGPGTSARCETCLGCECSLASGGGALDSSSGYGGGPERLRQRSVRSLPPSIAELSTGRTGALLFRCPCPDPRPRS